MKGSIFWDITPCSSLKVNLSFGGIHGLHLHGRRIIQEGSLKTVASRTDPEGGDMCLRQSRLTFSGLHGAISQNMELFREIKDFGYGRTRML
jgi:hypothetical protein